MKKLTLILLLLFCIAGLAGAAVKPPYGQVACVSTGTTVINPSSAFNSGYYHLAVLTLTPSNGVYIGPSSSITTTTAGIYLSNTSILGYTMDTTLNEAEYVNWYCITSSGTTTVGWQVR